MREPTVINDNAAWCCFCGAVRLDPFALVSDDDGDTWQYAGKLFARPKIGYVDGTRGYASGADRIDLIATDHHPRDYENPIYRGYLAGGALHRSDGAVGRSGRARRGRRLLRSAMKA